MFFEIPDLLILKVVIFVDFWGGNGHYKARWRFTEKVLAGFKVLVSSVNRLNFRVACGRSETEFRAPGGLEITSRLALKRP